MIDTSQVPLPRRATPEVDGMSAVQLRSAVTWAADGDLGEAKRTLDALPAGALPATVEVFTALLELTQARLELLNGVSTDAA